MGLRIGTVEGLVEPPGGITLPGPVRVFGDAAIAADGRVLWHSGGGWSLLASAPSLLCAVDAPGGLIVGTEDARLLQLGADGFLPLPGFDRCPGRAEWYTPWGGPPDVRSLACTLENVLLVSVHVGGIPRSSDGGRTWRPTIDLHDDVHQVRASREDPALAVAAAGVGLAVSRDAGETWSVRSEGLHAPYCRAVALDADVVLVSASEGPRGHRSAVYRARLSDDAPFERVTDWIDGNVDTYTLDARDDRAVFATRDGTVWESTDAGASWSVSERGLGPVTSLALTP